MLLDDFRSGLKTLRSESSLAFLLTILVLVLSILLHTKATWSPLLLDNDRWKASLDLHLNWYPFSTRWFQSYATILVHNITGLSAKTSFYSVQYALALILGPLFFNYLRKLRFDRNWSLCGMLLFLTSFPILCAHFEPVHTWDDFWMYLFTILAFMSVLDRKWYMTTLFFCLGCLAREQMLLFYPIWALMLWTLRRETPPTRTFIFLVTPIIICGLPHLLLGESVDPQRWQLITFNFANEPRAADSVVSILNAFGFIWVVCVVALVRFRSVTHSTSDRLLFWGTIVTVPLTLAVGIFFTLVRETRILFPPFVFVIPLSLHSLSSIWFDLRRNFPLLTRFGIVLSCPVFMFFGLKAAEVLWPVFEYGGSSGLRRDFAGVSIGLSAFILTVLLFTKLRRNQT